MREVIAGGGEKYGVADDGTIYCLVSCTWSRLRGVSSHMATRLRRMAGLIECSVKVAHSKRTGLHCEVAR
jgi:hypothetical protein